MNDRITTLSISSLVADPKVWPRQSWDEERVALFADLYKAEGPASLPPIVVVPRGDKYLVADGWTRTRAAVLVKFATIPAKVVDPPDGVEPADFAYRLALETAAASACPLTRSERHAAIARLLSATAPLPDRQIAKIVGVAHTTVSRFRRAEIDAASGEPGENHLASITAQDVAKRLFRSLEKVYQARGLGIGDGLMGDRTGQRLSEVLREAFGAEALAHARRYQAWLTRAIDLLQES